MSTTTTPTAPTAVDAPALDGVEVKLDGKTYILPPCSLATLRRHADAIDAFGRLGPGAAFGKTEVNTVISVTHEALRRNYLDITADFVAEHMAVDTMMGFFQAAMDASGLLRKSKASTAAQEGGTLGESTGTAFPLIS